MKDEFASAAAEFAAALAVAAVCVWLLVGDRWAVASLFGIK